MLRKEGGAPELTPKKLKEVDELVKKILASESMVYRADKFFWLMNWELDGYEELQQIVFNLDDRNRDITSVYRLGIDGWASSDFRHLDIIRD